MWYAIEAVAIVAIYTYKPQMGVWMNYWLRCGIAWARSQPQPTPPKQGV